MTVKLWSAICAPLHDRCERSIAAEEFLQAPGDDPLHMVGWILLAVQDRRMNSQREGVEPIVAGEGFEALK
jgi:hypothetical protein